MKGRLFKSMVAAYVAFMLLFAFAPMGYAADADPAVSNTNAKLFDALFAIGKPHANGTYYTQGELKSWTGTLDLSNKGITDARGLEYCSGITTLNLSGNDGLVSMPASMAGMTSLTNLYLNGYLPQTVADTKGAPMHVTGFLGAVATLPKFATANPDSTMLNISNTDVTNAAALNGCAGLKYLMWEYQDTAPATFPTCANLYYLNLAHDTTLNNAALTSIATDMPAFHTLGAAPSTLCISATAVTNVSTLAAAAGLRTLYWQDMPSLATAAGLASLTQLTGVDLVNDTSLHNAVLTTIAGMANVTTLGIGSCGITDLAALTTKTNLTTLSIGLNQIKSLAPLAGMNLYSLTANNNCISDLAPLSGMTNLTGLDVSQNYLDPTAGSPDRVILDAVAARQYSNVNYNQQLQFTIHYDAAPYTNPADATTYYGANVTLPSAVAGMPGNKELLGWDTDNSGGSQDHAGGSTIAFAWPVIPIPSGEVTFKAYFGDYTPPPPPPLSADSTLTALTASQPMTPAFASATLSYSVSLPATVDHVTLTATPAINATCTIDGAAGLSRDIAVAPGETKTVPIVVTAQNGVNTTTYTVAVTRAKPDAACKLTGISLAPSSAELSPAFSAGVTAYTVTLPQATGSVTITPAKPAKATMTVNGAAAPSATVTLGYGETKTVEIVVTAENGTDKTAYRLTVNRAKPDASQLMGLGCSAGSLSPAFTPAIKSYTLTLAEGVSSVTLSPVKASASAKLRINGHTRSSLKVTLKNGRSATVTVRVTGPGKAQTTYTITVKRKPSTNANLLSLSAGATLAPPFTAGTLNYSVSVPSGTSHVTIKAAKSSRYAVMTIDGKKVTKKTVSLARGQTKTVTIVVKAQAGNTKTYEITLTRM